MMLCDAAIAQISSISSALYTAEADHPRAEVGRLVGLLKCGIWICENMYLHSSVRLGSLVVVLREGKEGG